MPSAPLTTVGLMAGQKSRDKWDPIFKTRRQLPATENEPWIDHLEQQVSDRKRELQAEGHLDSHGGEEREEQSDAQKFMQGPREFDECMPDVEIVDAFCSGTALERLKATQWDGPKMTERVHLVERNFVGDIVCHRGAPQLLTPHLTYHALRKPVSILVTSLQQTRYTPYSAHLSLMSVSWAFSAFELGILTYLVVLAALVARAAGALRLQADLRVTPAQTENPTSLRLPWTVC
jgi:hypothetical protein